MPEVFAPPQTEQTPIYKPTEIIRVDDQVIACDGGVGVLGHPRVWLRSRSARRCARTARGCSC